MMLYSRSQSSEKFDLFSLFVSQYLNGQDNYKSLIDKVVLDTHLLANDEISVYDIDQDKFQIIVHLKNKATEYFQRLNPKQLREGDYQHISSLLKQKDESNA